MSPRERSGPADDSSHGVDSALQAGVPGRGDRGAFAWELSLAFWLIIKGFNVAALESQMGHVRVGFSLS